MSDFAFVVQPVVPVRDSASDRAEMVSQMLFGDTCEVLERQEKWSRIQCCADGYLGWVDNKQVETVSESDFDQLGGWQKVVATSLCTITLDGVLLTIPMGSRLPISGGDSVGGHDITYQVFEEEPPLGIGEVAVSLLGAPYLWGGKTLMGIDCSGLVQVCGRVMGKSLPRDASQQVMEGRQVHSLDVAQPNDICFFANDAGRIIHVGIYLGDGQIVHASGNVHVDTLDATGIFSHKYGCYTHRLHSIRRLW